MKKTFKIIANSFLVAIIFIGFLVVVSFLPIPGNYKIFTVRSGSMEPKIHTGSLVFTKPLEDYGVGDIVTKKTNDPKVTITHRITAIEEKDGQTFFQTKGDANSGADAEKIVKKDIIGKVFLSIPFLGYSVSYAKTTPGLIILIIIPAVIIIYDELRKIKEEVRKKLAYRALVKVRQKNDEEKMV